jgi:ATP-dependent Clp protease protease subunit
MPPQGVPDGVGKTFPERGVDSSHKNIIPQKPRLGKQRFSVQLSQNRKETLKISRGSCRLEKSGAPPHTRLLKNFLNHKVELNRRLAVLRRKKKPTAKSKKSRKFTRLGIAGLRQDDLLSILEQYRSFSTTSVFGKAALGLHCSEDFMNRYRENTHNSQDTRINPRRFNNEDEHEEEEGEKSKDSGTDLLLAKMLKTRTILLSGEIKKDLAEKTIRQLILLESAGKEPIRIFIDSPGGDADAGYAIFDMIRFIEPPVWTIGMGLVASAAAIIQLASPKERRVGLPNSHYLIHQPLSGIRGVATDIEIHARELDKLREKINRLIAGETGVPYEQVEKDTDRDYWMNAEEAASYGLISQVISHRSDLE